MTRKEEAKELVDKIRKVYSWLETDYNVDLYRDAKQCALICVDEQIRFVTEEMIQIDFGIRRIWIEELEAVKKEIENYNP